MRAWNRPSFLAPFLASSLKTLPAPLLVAGLALAGPGCTSVLGDDYFLLPPGEEAGGAGAGGSGAAGGAGGNLPKPDLATAVWDLENVSKTTATISHDGVLAIAGSKRWVVWSEPDDENLSDQAIWAKSSDGASAWVGGPIASYPEIQLVDPDITSAGEQVYVAFARDVDGFDDIFVARHDGNAWLQPANITASTKRPGTRNDYEPSIAVAPDGTLALAYLSYLPGQFSNAELRVVRFDEDGVAQAPSLDIVAGACEAPDAVFDDEGNLWVVVDCDDDTTDSVYLASDRTGSWQSQRIDGPGGTFIADPHLALDPNGSDVHVAWSGEVPCASGTLCNDIFYVRTRNGVLDGSARNLTPSDDVREAESSIAVDAHGRPIIVFHRFDDPDARIYFVWGEDDEFAEMKLVTPSTGADQWFPTSASVDPATQLPEFVYQRALPGTRPVNTEIFRGAMRPGVMQ